MNTGADDPAARDATRERIDQWVERQLPSLLAYVRARSGPLVRAKESLSDLVQSTCREVLEHADRFTGSDNDEQSFRAWLFTTAERKVRDKARYWKAERRDARREDLLRETLHCYDRMCTPSHQLSVDEKLHRVEQALDRMPADYREVIALHYIVGLKQVQIAEHLGRSAVAARQLLSRARARLAVELGDATDP